MNATNKVIVSGLSLGAFLFGGLPGYSWAESIQCEQTSPQATLLDEHEHHPPSGGHGGHGGGHGGHPGGGNGQPVNGVTLRIVESQRPGDSVGIPTLLATARQGSNYLSTNTLVGLSRKNGKIVYSDLFSERSFRLELEATGPEGDQISSVLVLNEGTWFASRFDGLRCSIEGKPVRELSACPSTAEAQNQLFRNVRQGTLQQLSALLGCGIDADVSDANGCSPLHLVTHLGCGAALPTGSAPPTSPHAPAATDTRGRGVLIEEEMIRALVAHGADMDAQDLRGQTALMNAVRNGQLQSVSALVELGADVDAQDATGMTALMIAASRGDEMAVRAMLENEPDLWMTNGAGKTASEIAMSRGNRRLAELLAPKAKIEKVIGAEDGSCSPTMIHIYVDKEVEIVLEASASKMFLLESKDLGLELMAMPGGTAKKKIRPKKTGTFPFTCGVHGAPADQQTQGSFMVM